MPPTHQTAMTWSLRCGDWRDLGEVCSGVEGTNCVERIIPQTAETALPGSLSRRYGLGTLPIHTDTAHWARPCRYLVMACAEVGPVPTATLLLDARHVRLSEPEEAACSSAVFLVRNGRRSFYGSIRERDREFIGLDPGCMAPLSCEGGLALQAFSFDRNRGALCQHDWETGVDPCYRQLARVARTRRWRAYSARARSSEGYGKMMKGQIPAGDHEGGPARQVARLCSSSLPRKAGQRFR